MRGFYLVDELSLAVRHCVRIARAVFAGLEDVYIQRHITIGHIERKVDQPRSLFVKGELEPLEPLEHGGIVIFRLGRGIGPLVVAAVNRLAKGEGLGRLPGGVRRGSDHSS